MKSAQKHKHLTASTPPKQNTNGFSMNWMALLRTIQTGLEYTKRFKTRLTLCLQCTLVGLIKLMQSNGAQWQTPWEHLKQRRATYPESHATGSQAINIVLASKKWWGGNVVEKRQRYNIKYRKIPQIFFLKASFVLFRFHVVERGMIVDLNLWNDLVIKS